MAKSTIELIKKGEGLTVEFKRTIDSIYKIAKTIVSFANTSGGVLLVGISDKGEIIGVESELLELQKLEKAAGQLVEKPIIIQFRSEIFDSKTVLRIEIDESPEKPHYAVNEKNDRLIYVRVKDKSVPTPKLLMRGENTESLKLADSRHMRTLIQFLREHDSVSPKIYARMINISEKRSERMLNDLTEKQILLKTVKGKLESFSLKWTG